MAELKGRFLLRKNEKIPGLSFCGEMVPGTELGRDLYREGTCTL